MKAKFIIYAGQLTIFRTFTKVLLAANLKFKTGKLKTGLISRF